MGLERNPEKGAPFLVPPHPHYRYKIPPSSRYHHSFSHSLQIFALKSLKRGHCPYREGQSTHGKGFHDLPRRENVPSLTAFIPRVKAEGGLTQEERNWSEAALN